MSRSVSNLRLSEQYEATKLALARYILANPNKRLNHTWAQFYMEWRKQRGMSTEPAEVKTEARGVTTKEEATGRDLLTQGSLFQGEGR